MNYILANWVDIYNQVYLSEIYPETTNVDELFDYFTLAKNTFDHKAIAREGTRLAFSDGTQVTLLKVPLQELPKKQTVTTISYQELEDYSHDVFGHPC